MHYLYAKIVFYSILLVKALISSGNQKQNAHDLKFESRRLEQSRFHRRLIHSIVSLFSASIWILTSSMWSFHSFLSHAFVFSIFKKKMDKIYVLQDNNTMRDPLFD